MQQAIQRRDVYTPALVATVNGVAVDASSVQVDRSLPDPINAETLTAASGTLEATDGPDLSSKVATPWDPSVQWPPAQESPVSITMDTGAGAVSILSGGRVVSSSGGTSDRSVSVDFADGYQTLDKTISWEPVAEAMPALLEGNPRRFVGMWTPSITDTILRSCGWYSTPPVQGFSVLSVPAQGTLWAERGLVASAGSAAGVGTEFPRFGVTPWGVGAVDASATYNVVSTYSIKSRGRMELSAMTMTSGSGTGRVSANTGTAGGVVRLTWSDTAGYVWIGGDGMTMTAVATVPRADGLLYATVEYVSDTSVQVILRSGTNTQTVTATVPASVTTGTVATCSILADGARSAGYQVAFPGTSGGLASWQANAQIHARVTNMNRLVVRKEAEAASCVELLAQQCEAESATYWIDETGVLHWWDMRELEKRGDVASLSSADHIGEGGFTWSHDTSQVKSRVVVKWRDVAQKISSRSNIEFWRGGGQTIPAGAGTQQEFVNAPDDEVWLMPDVTMGKLGTEDPTEFNHGNGSWYGAVISGSGPGMDTWAQATAAWDTTFDPVTPSSYKLTQTWAGSVEIVQRTPDDEVDSGIARIRRNFDLPVFRGKSKVTSTERDTVGVNIGPTSAPEMSIDAGWWIQSEEQAKYTADYVSARVTVPQPVLSAVDLIPIPGLQIGDIITIADEDVTRLTFRGIVVEDSRSIDGGLSMSHSIAVRPLEVSRNSVSWSEWATEARPKSWREWYLNQQSTWAEWGSDPLAKE